jgi:hypothetical protein
MLKERDDSTLKKGAHLKKITREPYKSLETALEKYFSGKLFNINEMEQLLDIDRSMALKLVHRSDRVIKVNNPQQKKSVYRIK